MKFVKSKTGKKLIIVLVVLLIFSVITPKKVKAWDLAGILMKPIYSIILAHIIELDVSLGVLLNGAASIGISLLR